MAATMTRKEMTEAIEFHLIAWTVLKSELNGR